MEEKVQIQIKCSEDVLKGVHANNLMVATLDGEFALDFINLVPPHAVVVSRVMLAPQNLKKILLALNGVLAKYEAANGVIKVGPAPDIKVGEIH